MYFHGSWRCPGRLPSPIAHMLRAHSPVCKFVLRIIKDVDIVHWRAKKSHTIQVIVVPSFNAAVQYNVFILPIPPNSILPVRYGTTQHNVPRKHVPEDGWRVRFILLSTSLVYVTNVLSSGILFCVGGPALMY